MRAAFILWNAPLRVAFILWNAPLRVALSLLHTEPMFGLMDASLAF